jgi:hypothetical protein
MDAAAQRAAGLRAAEAPIRQTVDHFVPGTVHLEASPGIGRREP